VKPPLVAFYGDDLTGSTDTLAVLAEAGLATMLFLDRPTPEERLAAGELDAFGIAGTARTMSPEQMDQQLPPIFDALRATGARLVHYKVCSTFDSSSTVGSIGHVIALARSRFRHGFVPIVVAQPNIGRHTVFGNHFAIASADNAVHRLDRHPTMSRHPVTPMHEADLRLVLARQGLARVALLDIHGLRGGEVAAEFARILSDAPDAVLFDLLEDSDLRVIGGLIAAELGSGDPIFGVGSSGLLQALIAGWIELATAGVRQTVPRLVYRADAVLVLSGSRSPVTAAQIETAAHAGFTLLSLDPARLCEPTAAGRHIAAYAEEAACHIIAGRSVIAHTSLGPDDSRALSNPDRETLDRLAHASGLIAREVLERVPIRRIGIAGGDTSSVAARALGVRALEYDFRLAPGVPVCRVRASGARLDGLQVMFKGGQMGPPDIFAQLVHLTDGSVGQLKANRVLDN
jgi:3-oxoisoapionate kinase